MKELFTLNDVGEIFADVKVSDLRNDIKRGVLRHVGEVPLASRERVFDYFGVIEIGLSRLMRRQGIPMNRSVNVINDILIHLKQQSQRAQLSTGAADGSCRRDPNNPVFAIFFPTQTDAVPNEYGLTARLAGLANMAHGWSDIGPAINRAYQRAATFDPAMLYGEPVASTNETLERAWRDRPVISLLNITEALIAIDRATDDWRRRKGATR